MNKRLITNPAKSRLSTDLFSKLLFHLLSGFHPTVKTSLQFINLKTLFRQYVSCFLLRFRYDNREQPVSKVAIRNLQQQQKIHRVH